MVSYYCSPFRGSDWGAGWGRAVEAARQFDVTVITSERSRHDVETYLRERGEIQNLRFVYLDSSRMEKILEKVPASFLYANPFSYARWQKRVARAALKLHAADPFDLAHQVNLIGFRQPGYLYKLGIPFVWGPIGGMQNYPFRFLTAAGPSGAAMELVRSAINWAQMRFSAKVRRAARSAAVVLAANSVAKRSIRKHQGREALLLLDVGIDAVQPKQPSGDRPGHIRILWSGELIPRKAIHLLLSALGSVRNEMSFELKVLGRGPLLSKALSMASELGIEDRCQFMGWLPRAEAAAQSEWADVFVFTSLRDTSGTVMIEAMSRGVPVICFDHQGARDIVTKKSGIKLPVTNPKDAVRRLAGALQTLAENRDLLNELSGGAAERAKEFLWSRNGSRMALIYRSVLAKAPDLV
ncbi:MAG: glycosyl transferase group 1 [Bryobacterales bacterium]|nr:glycosyl transferase group 1 [Bryobacterales bacterium]